MIDAMKQALEALGWTDEWRPQGLKERALTALSAAIEATEKQEPVAWGMKSLGGDFIIDCITPEEHESYEGAYTIPLYTAPPAQPAQQDPDGIGWLRKDGGYFTPPAAQRQWVGLTDEEAMQIWELVVKYAPSEVRLKSFARLIRDKLKDKNT